ncbi:MAG TPA: ComF family protein [Candidatus Nitrosotenuis sp.]|jgi:ComF family protein|nr:ComF family protein [Candidatus Nitrosotenuis sp.]
MYWIHRLSDIVLPPRCVNCGQETSHHHLLCPQCWSHISFIHPPYCSICGWPLPYEASSCGQCAKDLPIFQQGRSLFCYHSTIRALILKLKHHDATYIVPTLAHLLYRFGGDFLKDTDGLIPVPLHRWRLAHRGFNQMTLIANYLRTLHPIAVQVNVLKRYRFTPYQTQQLSHQRQSNVNSAFKVTAYGHKWLPHKRVVLLDDVWTTGATLTECCRMLLKAGAQEVKVLTIARVIPFS